MKTKKIYALALAVLAALSLASCEQTSLDGDWDPMEWKAEVPVQTTDGVYNVPATGAELTFSCQNYSTPWMAHAFWNGENYYPPAYYPPFESADYHTITTDWFKAEISGNKLKVVFEANDSGEERLMSLTVTAGDIFGTFRFRQPAGR